MNAEKHVLRQVLDPRAILDGARNQGEDQVLVAIDQLLKGAFVTGTAALHELVLVDRGHAPEY
jgi:hypothetical protein